MRAGQLRHRVTITATAETPDAHFGFDESAVILANRAPAKVLTLDGRELQRAQQIDARATHAVRLRYRPGVAAGQTVTYHDGRRGDRAFEIVAPPRDVEEMHRELYLLCRERDGAS